MARVGGEEFAVLLPGMDLSEAAHYARDQREGIAGQPFAWLGEEISVTVSMGVAEYSLGMRDPWTLFRAADRALVNAKQSGRNQVCLARGGE